MSTTTPLDPESAFTGRIKRVWISPFYLLGLMVVALAMVLLPIIYLGTVSGVGYLLYYHATENAAVLSGGRGGYRWRLVAYLAPLLVGGILLVFMVKPLFARPSRRDKRMSLVRENEPRLFAFVDRLCEVVGSPKPKRIDIDCQVNASASFRHGIWSLLLPGDLVLTIGVPLAAGLSLRDFTGVLAHEFGHFAQGLGMRFTYIINTVNRWFARVVYERDSWDDWLIDACSSENGWMSVIMYLARLFVWITRGILWILMMIGHAISCTMSRQMEYDADLHAIRTTGSASLESTHRALTLLSVAERGVYSDLRASWRDGKLADDMPILIAGKVDEIPPPIQAKLIEGFEREKTKLLDTHPSNAARIKRARKVDDPGVFNADGPASQLFDNFEGMSKAITLSHYREIIGPEVTPQNLISTADLTRRNAEARRSREAARRYYFDCLTIRRPLTLDGYSPNMKLPPEQAKANLKNLRATLAKHQSGIRKRFELYCEADSRIAQMDMLTAVLKAGKKFDAKEFDLSDATQESVDDVRRTALSTRRRLGDELAKIEHVMRTRTETALGLLASDALAKRVKNIQRLRQRSSTLLGSLHSVSGTAETLAKLRAELAGMEALGRILADDRENQDGIRHALRLTESQHSRLRSLREMLLQHDYPFNHASGTITMARYAMPDLPERQNFGGVYGASEQVLDYMNALYLRIFGDLAQICEAVESTLGMKPIPQATPNVQSKAGTKDKALAETKPDSV